jgi:hypothetical protein
MGPIEGILALPFWPLGPAPAYYITLLLANTLTAYATYLLARTLGLTRLPAVFSGLLFLLAPMRLAGTFGHADRLFTPLLPLALLCFHNAMVPTKSRLWSVLFGLSVVAIALHNGYQLVFAAVLLALLSAVMVLHPWYQASRRNVLTRIAMLAAVSGLMMAPYLLLVKLTLARSGIPVDNNIESVFYEPDLVQMFVPGISSRWFEILHVPDHFPGLTWGIETCISISLISAALLMIGIRRSGLTCRAYAIAFVGCAVLSLGPMLRIDGYDLFTEYSLPIPLPYALLTALPGVEFVRAAGRFMIPGYLALAIASAFGLSVVLDKYAGRRHILGILSLVAVAIELWPVSWPSATLPVVPEFYRSIASDGLEYGVFDLPTKINSSDPYFTVSSVYQWYQMSHGKGIASGYLSRNPESHPLFSCIMDYEEVVVEFRINGEGKGCYRYAEFDLWRYGYRYVVVHKPDGREGGSWGDVRAREFINAVFGDRPPAWDDGKLTAYEVRPTAEVVSAGENALHIRPTENWREPHTDRRWAASPARIAITSPREQDAVLSIVPEAIHQTNGSHGLGTTGVMSVQAGDAPATTRPIEIGRSTSFPIRLVRGEQSVTLTLQSGNFRPYQYGEKDQRLLSFAIRSIDLRSADFVGILVPEQY